MPTSPSTATADPRVGTIRPSAEGASSATRGARWKRGAVTPRRARGRARASAASALSACSRAPTLQAQVGGEGRLEAGEHRVHRRRRRRADLQACRRARGRIERGAQDVLVDLDRAADRVLGGGGQPRGGQRGRGIAGVDEVADGASDHLVGAAVVEAAFEREDVGDVGGGHEALARDLREALGMQLDAIEHRPRSAARRRRPRRARGARCRSAGGSGRCAPIPCAARRGRPRRRPPPGRPASARPRARRGSSSAASARSRGCARRRARRARTPGSRRSRGPAPSSLWWVAAIASVGEQLDVDVGLPGRVLGVLDEPVAAEQLGQAAAVERPARAGAAAGAGDAQPERAVRGAQALGVAQRRVGVGEQQVADGRRLGRLQVGVVGGERRSASRARGARAPRPGRAGRRAGRARARARRRRRPTRNASRRGRPALSQPAAERPTRRSSSASRELKASPSAGSQGNSSAGMSCSSSSPRSSPAPSSPRRRRRPRPARRRGPGRRARGRARAAGRARSRRRRRRRPARPPRLPRRRPPRPATRHRLTVREASLREPVVYGSACRLGRLGEGLGWEAEVQQADEAHVARDADRLARTRGGSSTPGRPPEAREAAAAGGQHRVLRWRRRSRRSPPRPPGRRCAACPRAPPSASAAA